MLSSNKIMLSLVLSVFILSSCQKNNSNNDPAPGKRSGGDQVTFDVNGKSWISDPASQNVSYKGFNLKAVDATIVNDTLTLIAFRFLNNDSSFIFIRVPLTAQKLGTYDLTEINNNILFVERTSLMSTMSLDPICHSTLTVTGFDAVNKKISGTFSGSMKFYPYYSDTYTITNGVIEDVSFK